ncbi:MAG: hemerythrin domain-containing protein [Nanoarchaeota archaeon]
MELIQQLKEEHKEIINAFDTILTAIKDKTADLDLVEHFRDMRDVLDNHLALEDKFLYPRLQKLEYDELKELANVFSDEMLKITKVVLAFFGNYEKKEISGLRKDAKFKKKLDELIKTVKRRVSVEENILFPAYEKYYKK